MTREEAIIIIRKMLACTDLTVRANLNADMVDACHLAIKALEQESRKGHWDIKDNMWWVCSACGCQTRMMKKYNVPNFCPACGAKMESEDNNA